MDGFKMADVKYSIEFEIMGLPKLPNQLLGRHWRARAGHAQQWLGKIMIAINRGQPSKPLKTALLTMTRFSSAEPDFDGLVGSFKSIVDALVKLDVLENDKPSNIGSPTYLWEKTKQGAGKIKVKVESI